MPADIFGQRLDADVGARGERVEQDSRGISIVDRQQRAGGVGGGGDRGDVLHLHRDRPRAFAPYDPRGRADQRGDVGADHRVVIFGRDPERGERAVGQFLVGIVGASRQQHMVARLAQRQIGQRDRRLATRHDQRLRGAFERADPQAQLARVVGVPPMP